MRTWDVILPAVMVHASAAPKSLAREQVRRAARDFCDKTRIWREPGSEWAHQGVTRYEVRAPDGAVLASVPEASLDGGALSPGQDYRVMSGVIVLTDDPRSARTLEYIATWMPSLSAKGMPEPILDRWSDAIAHGAVARLMEMPGKTWTSPEGSAYHDREYRAGIQAALNEDARQGTDQALTVKPRRFV